MVSSCVGSVDHKTVISTPISSTMQFSKALLLLLPGLCCVASLDHPNGRYRKVSTKAADNRALFLFGGDRECARQLSSCRTDKNDKNDDDAPPPFEEWVDMVTSILGNLDGDPDDTLLSDFVDVVLTFGTLNFLAYDVGFVNQWQVFIPDFALAGLQGVLALHFMTFDVEVIVQGALDALNVLGQAIGTFTETQIIPFYSDTLIPSLVSMLTLMRDVSYHFAQDNLDVLAASTKALADYVTDMASTILALLAPQEDADKKAALASCSVELMECKLDAMVMEVMPEMMGMTLTVAASEQQRRRRQ